jgi:hypothetical protein
MHNWMARKISAILNDINGSHGVIIVVDSAYNNVSSESEILYSMQQESLKYASQSMKL